MASHDNVGFKSPRYSQPRPNPQNGGNTFVRDPWFITNDKTIIHEEIGEFEFDHVFASHCTNLEVYERTSKPMIDKLLVGFNATIFAYGMTGSGKTFTMSGNEQELGLIPLSVSYLFSNVMELSMNGDKKFDVIISYLEIYNERIYDLLESGLEESLSRPSTPSRLYMGKGNSNGLSAELKIRDDTQYGVKAVSYTHLDVYKRQRVHCFIFKKRHAVGKSMHESPAQGLDDIWYCHTGTNVSYLNNSRMIQGTKFLLQEGDEIKVIWDKINNFVIGFKVEINDTTGLFNDGLGIPQEQRVIMKQTAEEQDLVKRLTQMMAAQRANQPSASSSSMVTNKSQIGVAANNSNNSVLSDLVEPPSNANTGNILKRIHSVSLSQSQIDPSKKVKRAKLDQTSKGPENLQFS